MTSPTKTALCTANTPEGICQANIADPLVYVEPPSGIFSYAKTGPSTGIYGSSIIRQQGFSLSDTITLTPRWLVRLAGSQDWTWTDSFADTASTGYRRTLIPGGYVSQGVSPSASMMFKPRGDMTLYATFADSIQAPDLAAASTGPEVVQCRLFHRWPVVRFYSTGRREWSNIAALRLRNGCNLGARERAFGDPSSGGLNKTQWTRPIAVRKSSGEDLSRSRPVFDGLRDAQNL